MTHLPTRISTSLLTLTIFALLLAPALPHTVHAQGIECEDEQFGCLEAGIPPFGQGASIGKIIDTDNGGVGLIGFINVLIKLLAPAIIVIGVIMIIAAGYVYMTAGGDAQKVGLAKSILGTALLGITLAAVSWAILGQVSPQFTTDAKDPVFVPPQQP